MFDPEEFFASQLASWPRCASGYRQLDGSRRRVLNLDGREYTLVHNPMRAASAGAKVENGKVSRPCFLCRGARPAEQRDYAVRPESGNTYLITVNPFPVLPRHFTIISGSHTPQKITAARLSDMAFMARMMKGYMVFFNGAASGASAPDHFHFQAVRLGDVPLASWKGGAAETLFVQKCAAENVKIDFGESDMTNILCWYDWDKPCWLVIRRRRHRPRQYSAEGDENVLISPASLEFAGMVPLARGEDFDKMDAGLLSDILSQCYDTQPLVDVGLAEGEVELRPNADGTTTVSGVRIGKNFHWDSEKTFTYGGRMLRRGNWLVNRLEAEEYLESVVSSEMAPTSSLNLLKAHAVISRSWLVRQMNRPKDGGGVRGADGGGEITRWYDAGSHELFDVCSDDHCQRYQGLPAGPSETAARAVRETRGEVLVCGESVIDARFSKCCGGRTEEYRYCWENINPPYLVSVPDTRPDGTVFCDVRDGKLLSRVLKDYDLSTGDFYSWEVVLTQDELSRLVEEKQGLGLGRIISLEPLERGPGGRISRLEVTGERGRVVIGKELEIRRTLSPSHLYSSAFDVLEGRDASGKKTFTLKGRGWGHGVGLCQIGAAVMGAEGYGYREILSHYYKGTSIRKIW